jgi:hypothetical protein
LNREHADMYAVQVAEASAEVDAAFEWLNDQRWGALLNRMGLGA